MNSSDRWPIMSEPVHPSIGSTRSSTCVMTADRFLPTVAVRGRLGTNNDGLTGAAS
jgi:hypothetical protein